MFNKCRQCKETIPNNKIICEICYKKAQDAIILDAVINLMAAKESLNSAIEHFSSDSMRDIVTLKLEQAIKNINIAKSISGIASAVRE